MWRERIKQKRKIDKHYKETQKEIKIMTKGPF
jgi:hypothetical protein